MKFNSKTLQASFNQAKPILENLKPLDPLSEDINELELFLKSLCIKESFTFNLNLNNTPVYQQELLIWDHRVQRLIYIKSTYAVSCLAHEKGYYQYINYDSKEILLEVPLIDAPSDVKIHINQGDKLALFLSLFTKNFNHPHPLPLPEIG